MSVLPVTHDWEQLRPIALAQLRVELEAPRPDRDRVAQILQALLQLHELLPPRSCEVLMSQDAASTRLELQRRLRLLEMHLMIVRRQPGEEERARQLEEQIQALCDELAAEEGA